jgi:hypothetical protein
MDKEKIQKNSILEITNKLEVDKKRYQELRPITEPY